MDHPLDVLNDIRIAAPCPLKWDDLEGDDAVRHCRECQHSVYNFAAMSRAEIEDLIGTADGRICARLYRRADGTIMTRDCPVGLREIRRRAARAAGRIAAALGVLLTGSFVFGRFAEERGARLRAFQPFAAIAERLAPAAPPIAPPPVMGIMMGRVGMPPTPACPPDESGDPS